MRGLARVFLFPLLQLVSHQQFPAVELEKGVEEEEASFLVQDTTAEEALLSTRCLLALRLENLE